MAHRQGAELLPWAEQARSCHSNRSPLLPWPRPLHSQLLHHLTAQPPHTWVKRKPPIQQPFPLCIQHPFVHLWAQVLLKYDNTNKPRHSNQVSSAPNLLGLLLFLNYLWNVYSDLVWSVFWKVLYGWWLAAPVQLLGFMKSTKKWILFLF